MPLPQTQEDRGFGCEIGPCVCVQAVGALGGRFRLESILGSSPCSLDERPVTKPNKGQDYASSVVKVHSRSLLLGSVTLAVHLISLPNLRGKPYEARIVIMALLS